jgi:hypothetical protein
MNHASWMDVWVSALAAAILEPVWIQMALALGAAFAAVMCLEGIRASFLPQRHAATISARCAPDAAPSSIAESSASGSLQPVRAKHCAMPRRVVKNRKRAVSSVNRHTPPRPRIQRIVLVKTPPGDGPLG